MALTFRGFIEDSFTLCPAFLFAVSVLESPLRLLKFASRVKHIIPLVSPREFLDPKERDPKDTLAEGKVQNPVDSEERRFSINCLTRSAKPMPRVVEPYVFRALRSSSSGWRTGLQKRHCQEPLLQCWERFSALWAYSLLIVHPEALYWRMSLALMLVPATQNVSSDRNEVMQGKACPEIPAALYTKIIVNLLSALSVLARNDR